MASITYNSFWYDVATGNIRGDQDSFKCILAPAGYTPNKDSHTKRSDIVEVTGTNYTSGGQAVTCVLSKDNATDRINYTFSNPSWSNVTITARYAIVYKSRGGSAAADELVACVDFGADVSSSNANFNVTFTNSLYLQN